MFVVCIALGLYNEAHSDLLRAKNSCRRLLGHPSLMNRDSWLCPLQSEAGVDESSGKEWMDQVKSELKKVRYLYKQVGQIRISAKVSPPVALRLSPSNVSR